MSKREIVLDTETTGLEPTQGHKLIEIACVEIIDFTPTGKTFHSYINPQRDIPREATAVHGIVLEKLLDKPVFAKIADDFLEFIGESRLIIHNAKFDMKFINHELKLLNKEILAMERVFCTLDESRKRFPGSQANLDALCKRFNIDNSLRIKHGALLDANLLAKIYALLMSGNQASLALNTKKSTINDNTTDKVKKIYPYRSFKPTEDELKSHEEFMKKIKK